ncbi:Rossmann-like and DUF2520 domain-containing protein [Trinickia soli]|uniref:DUF2520 domain-containing protein n=1 Tax=Trinickia soli TaxID=380675 RepID=A0A2N7WCK7_9BURK|nr:DUF2520 domain-containing protein [Trinickia soli]PMS27085.1 DUF2520 domain-containing protein [Trinickia soli]CAB3712621.1 hypothetical protein LMG24076_04092 [Trinickia soli]
MPPSSTRPFPARPRLGFVGVGRLARCLAAGFAAAGYPVVAVAGRSPASAQRLADNLPHCRAVSDAQAVVDASELVFLAVPDDNIGTIANELRFDACDGRSMALVHCSGATDVEVLARAREQGALIGGFHPLYLFSGEAADLERIAGCSVTIEAQAELAAVLEALARALGCATLALPGGQRMLYHGAAHYAASFALAALGEATDIWRRLGFDEEQALRALLPMLAGTVEAARGKGLAGALAGPVSRGDASVLEQQLAAFETLGEDHAALYGLLSRRALALVRRRAQPPASVEAMADAVQASLERSLARSAGST